MSANLSLSSNDDIVGTTVNEIISILGTDESDFPLSANIEDGWDAIEHTVAEYDFREGAKPVFILVQSDDSRLIANDTLSLSGIQSTLGSVNATLHVVTPGALDLTTLNDNHDWFELFDINSTTDNERVLGVEADVDGDGNHNAIVFDTLANAVALPTLFNESNDDIVAEPEDLSRLATDAETTYVKLAWETGGSVWDIGIIDPQNQGVVNTDDGSPTEAAKALAQEIGKSIASAVLNAEADELDIIDGVANALPLLEPGGPLEEFTHASSADVFDLFTSAGIDQSTPDTILQSGEPMFKLLELLERTPVPEVPQSGGSFSFFSLFGVVSELELESSSTPPRAHQAISGNIQFDSNNIIIGASINHQTRLASYQPNNSGLFLFRQAVPEPNAMTILITSSLSFGLSNLRC